MRKYRRLDNGLATTADDPKRGIWYASCGFWTDDWNQLAAATPGIPICPKCGCPGYQNEAEKWFEGAKQYEDDKHPGYVQFLEELKETCCGRNFSFATYYEKWREDNEEKEKS